MNKPPRIINEELPCTVERCNEKRKGNFQYCERHELRAYSNGDPTREPAKLAQYRDEELFDIRSHVEGHKDKQPVSGMVEKIKPAAAAVRKQYPGAAIEDEAAFVHVCARVLFGQHNAAYRIGGTFGMKAADWDRCELAKAVLRAAKLGPNARKPSGTVLRILGAAVVENGLFEADTLASLIDDEWLGRTEYFASRSGSYRFN